MAAKVRQDIRDSWDMETITLQRNIGSAAQLTPATTSRLSQEAESAVQKLLIFFRPRLDHQRITQLCNLLLMAGTVKTRLVAVPFLSTPDQQSSWQRLVGRLLPVLVRHLGDYSDW